MLFRNLNQTFPGFAALRLWAAPTDQTLTPRSVRSACNPSHSRCFETPLLSVTRYASLSDRGPEGFALTPTTFPVCLPPPWCSCCCCRRKIPEMSSQSVIRFGQLKGKEGGRKSRRGQKRKQKKKQIAVGFTSSRLSAAKKNRTEQTLASPRFIYTNAGSYKGNNSSCPTALPNRIYCDFYLESNNLFPGGMFTKSSQNDDNTIPLWHLKKWFRGKRPLSYLFYWFTMNQLSCYQIEQLSVLINIKH